MITTKTIGKTRKQRSAKQFRPKKESSSDFENKIEAMEQRSAKQFGPKKESNSDDENEIEVLKDEVNADTDLDVGGYHKFRSQSSADTRCWSDITHRLIKLLRYTAYEEEKLDKEEYMNTDAVLAELRRHHFNVNFSDLLSITQTSISKRGKARFEIWVPSSHY